MPTQSSKRLRWLLTAVLVLVALYCLLAVLQASSIYSGQRLAFNLNFWGSLGLASLAGGYVAAPRPGLGSPSFWNQWLAPFVWACFGVAALWQPIEFTFANLACQRIDQSYDPVVHQCSIQGDFATSLLQTQTLSVVAVAIAAGLLWRSLVRRRKSAVGSSAA